ncbi:recombinase family protein [Vibrio vulnificus]|nr:recombinase family protein [Vibrio vulnificus]EIT7020590.1 recombinase family protein [Vibrio vulnificus]EIV8619725.1 recombinase family protein [Vibrio vulnificus]EKA7344341.1 recombinase family protein [Vibrio vulnificus]ELQ2523611.1 recombinase family protein [Vibrio vulnificus]
MKKAYSYIRYSSPQQASGDSYRRQLAATQAYCDANGYELDTELSIYKELGVSGFKGDQEHLKQFINDCETGKVKKGSLLVVENLDRLSRQAINVAMRQFLSLLEYVDIYTLQDKKHYSNNDGRDSENQLLDIMTSLIIMSRAHEESLTKQKRLKESWANQRKNAHRIKMSGCYPHWLVRSDDKTEFFVKEDRAQIIKDMLDMCINGLGATQIVRSLNQNIERYPPPSPKKEFWVRSTVKRLLSDRRLLGEHQLYKGHHAKREPVGEPIKGYFPQIVDEKTFANVQISLKSRKIGAGKVKADSFSNIFRGFLRCGHCDSPVEYVNKAAKQASTLYLTCSNAKRGGDCNHSKHYRYLPLEHMLIHLSTANGFLPKPEKPSDLEQQLEIIKEKKEQANKKLSVLLEKNFTAPIILEKIEELTNDVEQYNSQIEEIEDKLLSIKPDYTYEDLYHDAILESDLLKKFSNRSMFNNYLRKKIDSAYLYSIGLFPCIAFKMNDKSVHVLVLDERYNFGGCSLPNEKDKLIRLNGEGIEAIDEIIWKMFGNAIDFINGIDEENEELNKIIRKISLLMSKFIIDNQNQDLISEFNSLLNTSIEKSYQN